MRRSRYSYAKTRRKGTLVLLLTLTVLLLGSCMASSNVLWIKGLFGLDISDYLAEPVQKELQPSGTAATILTDMVQILVSDNFALKEFQGTAEAVKLYRDDILNHMLRNNYALYTGERSAISAVKEAYPHTSAATLISAESFENTVFRYFGGTTVSHGDGEVFSYLRQAGYYSSPLQGRECRVDVAVTKLEETEHTYRMHFYLTDGTEISESYLAVFVKRTDGTCYWKALQAV